VLSSQWLFPSRDREEAVTKGKARGIILLSRRGKNEFPGEEKKNNETDYEKENEPVFSPRLGFDALKAALRWRRRGVCLDLQEEARMAAVAAVRIASEETVEAFGKARAMRPAKGGSFAGRALNRFGRVASHPTRFTGRRKHPIISMTTISSCILSNLGIHLHMPMPYSLWEPACPSATRVGVRRPGLFDNCIEHKSQAANAPPESG